MDTDGDPNNDELFFEERAMRTREEALSALYEALDLCP